MEDDNFYWTPLDNEEINEGYLDYYKEEYNLNIVEEILSLKKNFILKDETLIKSKLDEIGIIYNDILEY